MIGDVVGQPGGRALFFGLPRLVKSNQPDLVVANGENAAGGLGLTPEIADNFFRAGVDIITSGNHIWQRAEILPLLERGERVLRPENYPLGVPGHGHCLVTKRDLVFGVLNLEGRVLMGNTRCPFLVGRETAQKLRRKTNLLMVDFHAESPEEKEALAVHLDGLVSAVVGTHTHVQTADERILPEGTGYLTDVGMTGPVGSVIGMKREVSLKRSLTQIPYKMEVEESHPVLMAALLELEPESGRALAVHRIQQEFPQLT